MWNDSGYAASVLERTSSQVTHQANASGPIDEVPTAKGNRLTEFSCKDAILRWNMLLSHRKTRRS